jgi:hypothetical protein
MEWINVAQYRNKKEATVNMVMELHIVWDVLN